MKIGKSVGSVVWTLAIGFYAHDSVAEEKRIFFLVSGKNAEELNNSVRGKNPRGGFGYTMVDIVRVNPVLKREGDYFSIERIDYKQNIRVYFPRWVDGESADACLQEEWRKINEQAEIYEKKHIKIYVEFKNIVYDELGKIEVISSRKKLKKLTKDRFNSLYNDMKKRVTAISPFGQKLKSCGQP